MHSATLSAVFGQSDQLLCLTVDDFRFVADFQSRLYEPTAQAISWVFAVPYVLLDAEPDKSLSQPKHEELSSAESCDFVIYIRIRRPIYHRLGAHAEGDIVTKIQVAASSLGTTLRDFRTHYSLSWPDLVVTGRIDEPGKHLLDFLLALQGITVAIDGADELVVRKTLTILGVPVEDLLTGESLLPSTDTPKNGTSRLENGSAVFFLRNKPGHFSSALDAVAASVSTIGTPELKALSLDGTWDSLLVALDQLPSPQDLLSRLADGSDDLVAHGVERIHTHLLVRSTGIAGSSATANPSPPPPSSSERTSCDCSTIGGFEQLRSILHEAETTAQLPRSLVRTVVNYITVFSHMRHDSSNCCDTMPALIAHCRGLERLLSSLAYMHAALASAQDEEQITYYGEITSLHSHFQHWCLLADRILRERTAASFERIFVPSYSVASLRGGLQKLLFLAERLMDEFYRRIPTSPHSAPGQQSLRFSAIYEPRSTPTSIPLLGLVNLPLRHAFSLHILVPQLCHEVGQHVFATKYEIPHNYGGILQNRYRMLRAALAGPELTATKEQLSLLHDHLGDFYADLLVYLYAFHGSFSRFCRYLTVLALESSKDRREFQGLRRSDSTLLLMRLHYVLQFSAIMTELYKRRGDVADEELNAVCDRAQESFLAMRHRNMQALVDIIESLVLSSDGRYSRFKLPGKSIWEAARNVEKPSYASFLDFFLRDVVGEISRSSQWRTYWKSSPRLQEDLSNNIANGIVTDLGDSEDIVDYFLALFDLEMVTAIGAPSTPAVERTPLFRRMATLGRSAILTYYRRLRVVSPVAEA